MFLHIAAKDVLTKKFDKIQNIIFNYYSKNIWLLLFIKLSLLTLFRNINIFLGALYSACSGIESGFFFGNWFSKKQTIQPDICRTKYIQFNAIK